MNMQVLKKHPIAVIFWVLYTLNCLNILRINHQFKDYLDKHPGISGIEAGGEGLAWAAIGLCIFGTIFSLISGAYAIGSKTETRFYLWLILIIIVETITTLNIG